MKKKPHHSTVFRRKATEQINQLQNQVNVLTEVNRSLQSAVRRLEDDRKPLDVKLVSLSTKLSATVEGRDNLLKTVEEKQQTIDRLTAALREIYEATIGVVIDPEMDPAIQALNAVKDQMAHSERLAMRSRSSVTMNPHWQDRKSSPTAWPGSTRSPLEGKCHPACPHPACVWRWSRR